MNGASWRSRQALLSCTRWCFQVLGASVLALLAVVLGGWAVSAEQSVPPLAYDGRGLFRETPATQAIFQAVWGDRAPTRWVEEHNAALGGGDQVTRPRIVFFSINPAWANGEGGGVDAFIGGLRAARR